MDQGNHRSSESAKEKPMTRQIVVFGLSLGSGQERIYGPLVRQATDDLARCISTFTGLIGRAHHRLSLNEVRIDPHLGPDRPDQGDDLDGDALMRRAFGAVIRRPIEIGGPLSRMTRAQGAHLALTGRLGWFEERLGASLNLWDVTGPRLLMCRVKLAQEDALPDTLVDACAAIAYALESPDASTLSQAQAHASAAVGTRSMTAYRAMAAATERLRPAALGLGEVQAPDSALRALCAALREDPEYEAARLLLAQRAMEHLVARDVRCASVLAEATANFGAQDLMLGLVRVESLMLLKQHDDATAVLNALDNAHGPARALDVARQRLTTAAQTP